MHVSSPLPVRQLMTTVLVPDRVGLLRDITRVVFDLDGNIGSIRQIIVDGYFNLVFSSEHPAEITPAMLRTQLMEALRNLAVLNVIDRPDLPPQSVTDGSRFVVMTRGDDKPGTILAITSFLVNHGVNIEDWLVNEDDGQVVYLAQVVVLQTTDYQALQQAFQQTMSTRGLTALLCHENIFRATNEIGPIRSLLGDAPC